MHCACVPQLFLCVLQCLEQAWGCRQLKIKVTFSCINTCCFQDSSVWGIGRQQGCSARTGGRGIPPWDSTAQCPPRAPAHPGTLLLLLLLLLSASPLVWMAPKAGASGNHPSPNTSFLLVAFNSRKLMGLS